MVRSSLSRLASYADLAMTLGRQSMGSSIPMVEFEAIAKRLGKMHGLPQKIGQMVSFRDSTSDGENALATLQEGGEALTLDEFCRELETHWQCPWEDVLSEIEEPAYAASLGQVHRGRLHSGQPVAIKIKYPEIDSAVSTDLSMIKMLSLPFGGLGRGFDVSAYQDAFRETLLRELDYQVEAHTQAFVRQQVIDRKRLAVPEVVEDWCGPSVLVSEWFEGERWEDAEPRWNSAERLALGGELLHFFFAGLFEWGVLHADWHPGNLKVLSRHGEQAVGFLDFGCVFRPTRHDQLALARLIQATIARDEPVLPLLVTLGFSETLLQPMADKLPAVCRVLFEPLCVDYAYDLRDWKLQERLADLLGEDRWNFRMASAPRLLLFVRAFQGLAFYLKRLGTAFRWRPVFEQSIESLRSEMHDFPVPACPPEMQGGELSRHLKIRVSEGAQTKVQISQNAIAVERLTELLDEELLERIRNNGIRLDEVVKRARQMAYAPGPLLSIAHQTKQIDVWLE